MSWSKEELQRGLTTRILGRKLFVFDSIDSTNACAKTLGDAGTEEGAVVIADYQTEGKGRLGRSWLAEPGRNLLFSALLRPSTSVEMSGLLTFYAAVAIAKALEASAGVPVECKWPNDILINGKKCSGILLENSFQQNVLSYSVIGCGINVNQCTFPTELRDRVTSLALISGVEYDRKQLLQKILAEMDLLYLSVLRGDFERILDEWLRRCHMFGKDITIRQHNQLLVGKALRLNDDGSLVIQTPNGTATVYAGEVSIIL